MLCTFLFVLFDFIQKTTNYFARYKPQATHIIAFYAYQIPALVVQVIPIASLLGSVITMVILSRSNEVTAMRAAGMGPFRIGMPIALGGAFLSLVSLVGSEYVIPASAAKMHFVEEVLIEGSSELQVADGARWVRDDKSLIHFDNYDTMNKSLSNVRIIDVGQDFKPVRITEAASARFLSVDKVWMMESVKILNLGNSVAVSSIEKVPHVAMALPMRPDRLKRERRNTNELKFSELLAAIDQGQAMGQDVSSYRVDFHMKVAYPFAAFVVCLIGLKFAYRFERSLETAKGVLLAFAVGMSYWFILNACRALGKQGTLPPLLAAWAANFVVGAIGVLMIWNAKRTS